MTLPTDWRTKRQKGDDYPLAEVSSLKKGWAEQADAFASYLIGMTPEQVSMLKVDEDGKPTDADLLSGCTIAVWVCAEDVPLLPFMLPELPDPAFVLPQAVSSSAAAMAQGREN